MNRESEQDTPPIADVEIGAAVRARRLRFNRVPETEVRFDPARDSDSHTQRENLPEEVEPDVTYKDVRVRWRGSAGIAAKSDESPPDDRRG